MDDLGDFGAPEAPYVTHIFDLPFSDLIQCHGSDAFNLWLDTLWQEHTGLSLVNARDMYSNVVEAFVNDCGQSIVRVRVTAWYEDTP